jgi:hypothetical protein
MKTGAPVSAELLIPPMSTRTGGELDRKHLGRTNWQIVKTAIDQKVNVLVGRRPGERHWLTQPDLDLLSFVGWVDGWADAV